MEQTYKRRFTYSRQESECEFCWRGEGGRLWELLFIEEIEPNLSGCIDRLGAFSLVSCDRPGSWRVLRMKS